VSRVKALLARASAAQKATPSTGSLLERGKLIAMLGAKGGLGVTTLALNTAVAMAQTGNDVILCELRPGQGSLGLQLGFSASKALGNLLGRPAAEISSHLIEGQLVSHGSGVRLLLASCEPHEMTMEAHAAQAEQWVKQLSTMTKFLILDLGPGLTEINKKVLPLCDRHLMVVEPMRVTLIMAKAILDEMEKMGISANRFEMIMLNRVRSSLQMPWQQAEAILNHSIASIVTPAPELSYQAAEAAVPMIQMQPESLTADQSRKLAEMLTQKGKSAGKV